MKTIFDNLNNGVNFTNTVVKVVDYRKLKGILKKRYIDIKSFRVI